ncbi:MAG: SAM-dependent methyltransferase [Flexistipes sinusarabici]|uniref:SAM-dependent methyltransferase n=1 Tax=Flexistipes sinusarabici TaxID=2352 RepID=A0A5D0MQ39_FLESI|nr:SAM-dependent methyltransferase [Flexistipes sinusarabici]TYB33720.1 MAG: SAM-dependent methyltransferase [Flexistipes sinusarabici]
MDNQLEIIVKNKIKEKGKITFAEFMDMALYYPELGYYQKENPFGEQGSFYTSVNASSSFGRSIASGFVRIFESTGIEQNICEMGAGSGYLAKDILDYYKQEFPEIYSNLSYLIIEKSEYLTERQKELLKEHTDAGKIEWRDFENFAYFNGIFFSNELVDAFPVHRIINIDGEYKELYVINHNNELQFYPDEISSPEIEEYMHQADVKLNNKQMGDISICAVDWIKSLGSKISKGFVITIDYGFEAGQLYSDFRVDGTVTCYFKHKQNNDFFERIGYQDITAFVDFSGLEIYGREFGLEKLSFMPQWLFLIQCGILNEMEKAESDLQKTAIKSLIVPEGGFGTNFHVLVQTKNVEIPEDFVFNKSSFETFDMLSRIF